MHGVHFKMPPQEIEVFSCSHPMVTVSERAMVGTCGECGQLLEGRDLVKCLLSNTRALERDNTRLRKMVVELVSREMDL